MTEVISHVVEVCLFRLRGGRAEYLLLRRSADEPVYPGMWQIITGTVGPGEKGLDAARREVREETGQVPERFWVVPYTHAFYDHRRDAVIIVPFFAGQLPADGRVVLSAEHVECAWLPYSEAHDRLVWPGQRAGLDVVERTIVGGEEASRLIEVPA